MRFNLPLSLFIGVIGMLIRKSYLTGFVSSFNLSLLTGGFILSLYFYEQRYKQQYYFYHNRGFSRFVLITCSAAINLLVAVLLYAISFSAHA
ncbi:hypothetical protein ACFSKU_04640 [Pontibacter silvestris]|uniref:Uncharacterized protein n=1 Tax=Pontibacter silvestris TaxID=2305183 RepID=A0ABW4WTS4_9BACT|nr:hypothetical protein [Pontibacter silvestris]MCC9137264.1 hypothetical protein [Pontibacter silvestris]